MSDKLFKAMVVTEVAEKKFERQIKERSISELPEGEVLIRVHYSSLNYKDALSASGHKGVTRKYPHTPGIDAAGIVEESSSPDFQIGDEVLVTGYDLGMNTAGGFGQYIRVPADWVVKLPKNLSLRESMILGTAGFTAAISVFKLSKNGVTPEKGDVLVTGATGGVGSLAVAILAKAGYRVVAATRKTDNHDYLRNIGASEIIDAAEVNDTSGKPLLKTRWAGVVENVGGNILATAIKSTDYHGTVTTCGNVGGAELSTTVFPFILRGVSLIGIDSATSPRDLRLQLWQKLANEWKLDNLEQIATEVSLEQLNEKIELILQSKLVGRTIINLTI